MALQQTTEFKGLQVINGYYRIWGVSIKKDSISFGLELLTTSTGERLDSTSLECSYNINGENPFKQAYEYLKTLPEFVDAVDC